MRPSRLLHRRSGASWSAAQHETRRRAEGHVPCVDMAGCPWCGCVHFGIRGKKVDALRMSLTFNWVKTDPVEIFCAWTQSGGPLESAHGEARSQGKARLTLQIGTRMCNQGDFGPQMNLTSHIYLYKSIPKMNIKIGRLSFYFTYTVNNLRRLGCIFCIFFNLGICALFVHLSCTLVICQPPFFVFCFDLKVVRPETNLGQNLVWLKHI